MINPTLSYLSKYWFSPFILEQSQSLPWYYINPLKTSFQTKSIQIKSCFLTLLCAVFAYQDTLRQDFLWYPYWPMVRETLIFILSLLFHQNMNLQHRLQWSVPDMNFVKQSASLFFPSKSNTHHMTGHSLACILKWYRHILILYSYLFSSVTLPNRIVLIEETGFAINCNSHHSQLIIHWAYHGLHRPQGNKLWSGRGRFHIFLSLGTLNYWVINR